MRENNLARVASRANPIPRPYRDRAVPAALRAVAAVAIALVLDACSDHDPQEPAVAAPAQLAIGASFGNAAGGIREAYDRTDRLAVTILDSAAVRFEQELPFDPSAVQTRVQLAVPLRATTETFVLELELRRGGDPVFSGRAEVTLSAGATSAVEVALQPVLTAVACAGEDIVFDAYGERTRIGAAALFVTGDTIPDRAIDWSSQDAAVATVQSSGLVTAVADGETEIQCAAGSFTDSRSVRVWAEVASVTVAPLRATLQRGGTQQFTATLRDRRDNVIGGRTVAWTSTDVEVATVTQTGIATAVAPGTARIDATSDGVTGSATLVVAQSSPTVATAPASDVDSASAVVNGTVNPNGGPTVAWFEWGTSASLASFSSTPQQEVGNGSTAQPVSAPLLGLTANVTYYFRVAASNQDGEVRGEIMSFTPSLAPDAVTGEASAAQRSAVLNGTVTPNGLATDYWFEWGADPGLEQSTSTPVADAGAGRQPVDIARELGELRPGTTYYFRVVARSEAGTTMGDIVSFRTTQPLPAVTTAPASDVGSSSAVVNGTVNPNGASTVAWFEWSTIPSLGEFISTPRQEVGGSTAQPISERLVELVPNVTHYFRAAASNQAGTLRGDILSFMPLLPPDAVTGNASPDARSAVLFGVVNPNGLATDYWFEWGTDPELATSTSTPETGLDAGREPLDVAGQLGGLETGTTYYFRVVARSAAGTTMGDIVPFRTLIIVDSVGIRNVPQ